MKIYFSAALLYKDKRGHTYKKIMEFITKNGHKLLNYDMDRDIFEIQKLTESDYKKHYKAVIKWINESDLVVIEASFPSTMHIGHEISLALQKNKPVIVLYEEGYTPFFLEGSEAEKLILAPYQDKNLEKVLKNFIDYASMQQDLRFNIMLTPEIYNMLSESAKKENTTKASLIRKLIKDNYNSH